MVKLKDLEQKIERLEEQFIERDKFINLLAHDLIDPLATALTALRYLEADQQCMESETVKFAVDIIRRGILRTEILVKSFLDVKKIEHGKALPVHMRNQDFIACIKEALSIFNRPNLKFKCDHPRIESIIDCDLISRAITNLIANAFKYGDNSKEIAVDCELDDNFVKVCVHNWGESIPQSELEEIFDAYSVGKESGRRGWGLGLAFVKAVADLHNGSIKVISSKEKGTSFTLSIPRSART